MGEGGGYKNAFFVKIQNVHQKDVHVHFNRESKESFSISAACCIGDHEL